MGLPAIPPHLTAEQLARLTISVPDQVLGEMREIESQPVLLIDGQPLKMPQPAEGGADL